MNSTGVMFRAARSLRTRSRSPEKPRERTSITMASWVIRDPAARPVSTIRAISSGAGCRRRTNPGPEHLGGGVAAGSPTGRSRGRRRCRRRRHRRRHHGPRRRCRVIGISVSRLAVHHRPPLRRLHRNRADRLHAEGFERTAAAVAAPMPGTAVISSTLAAAAGPATRNGDQRFAPRVAQPADGVQGRGRHALGPLAAVVGDGEAVRLIADALEQVQPSELRGRITGSGRRAPRPPRGVWPVRSRRHRSRRGRREPLGRVHLRCAAVHHERFGG